MNKGIEKPKLKLDPGLVLIIQTKPGPRNAVDEKYVVGQTRMNFHVISLISCNGILLGVEKAEMSLRPH